MIGVGAVTVPASATHAHSIVTPGTCVDKAGAGFGTGEVHPTTPPPYPPSLTDPSFHTRVHKGTPGLHAFENPNNDVSVVAGLCP